MKATFNADAKTKFTSSHRKEGKYYFESYNIISPSEYGKNNSHAPIELRIYGTGTKNYACLWVNSSPIHTSGTGSAGGYGYHRPSAAADEAIRNAGFSLSEDISGRGDNAIEIALKAIAECLGLKDYLFFKAHQ